MPVIVVDADSLSPIELEIGEHVAVRMPDGRVVTVHSDKVELASREEDENHQPGKVIWPRSGDISSLSKILIVMTLMFSMSALGWVLYVAGYVAGSDAVLGR